MSGEYEENLKWIGNKMDSSGEERIAELYLNLGILADYASQLGNGLGTAMKTLIDTLRKGEKAKGASPGFIEHILVGTAGENLSKLVKAISTFENYEESIKGMVAVGQAYKKKNEGTLYSAEIGNSLTAIGNALKPKYS